MARFKVLVGVHSEGGKTYGKNEEAGDIVETDNDLTKHNSQGSIKFALVSNDGGMVIHEVTPDADEDDDGNPDFDKMSLKQLREFGDANDLEFQANGNKADTLSDIKAQWGELTDG